MLLSYSTLFIAFYQQKVSKNEVFKQIFVKVRVFLKNIEKKHLCRHDKNYYHFCKSNIPVINLIVGSRNCQAKLLVV